MKRLASIVLTAFLSLSLAFAAPLVPAPPISSFPFSASGISGSTSTVAAMLARAVSVDDAAGIHHDGATDDTAIIQKLLNAVGLAGGGAVLVGPHQYALGSNAPANLQPTAAQFNSSGFTLTVTNASSYYTVGSSYTLTGFNAPLSQLNGSWTIGAVSSGDVVVYTALTGSQSSTSTGLGTVYQNLAIPSNVELICPKGLTGEPPSGLSYSQLPYTFLTGSIATIAPQQNSKFIGCNVVNNAVASLVQSTASIRQNINVQSAFAGSGISVSSSDVQLQDLLVVGYATGIASESGARGRWEHINIDATACATTDNSHDISHYIDLHCYPFATGGTNQFASGSVTGVANNGSGLWRVTTALATTAIVGDIVYVTGVTGAGSVNNTYTVSATDGATYLDLAGSNATGTSTYTATTTSGSYCLKAFSGTAAQMNAIGVGDAIAGTNIPASTTITDVLPLEGTICMSATATATGTGVAIATTPQSYSSGGTVYLDSTKRAGKGLSWTNGETNACTDCYVYGHLEGIYVGAGSSWTSLTNVKVDNYVYEADRNTICFQIDGSALGTFIHGGSTNSCWVPFLGTSTSANQAHLITGMVLNSFSTSRGLELQSGRYEFFGNSSGSSASNFVGDGIGLLGYGGNDFKAKWEFQSSVGFFAVNPTGNTFNTNTTYQGNWYQSGQVSIGGGSTYCNQFSNCGVTLNGPLFDASASSGPYNAYTIPQNDGSWLFTGSGTVASYTATLPVPVNGERLTVAFQYAVTSFTLAAASGTVASQPYSSIAAGQILYCEAWSTTWYCR